MAGDDSSKDHFVSDKQVRAGISTDETENVVAYHPAICQLDHHEEVHTSENTSSEMNENDSDDSPSSSAASEVSSSEYCPTPMKRARVRKQSFYVSDNTTGCFFESDKYYILVLHPKLCGEACSC